MNSENLMYRRAAALILLMVVFVCSSCSMVSARRIHGSDFALVVDSPDPDHCGLYAVGKIKTDVELTVLQAGPVKTCAARTTANRELLESSGAYLTEIFGSCESPSEFGIAVIKKPVEDYERLRSAEVSDKNEISRLDRIVRSSGVLSLLMKKAQGDIPGEITELEGSRPRAYRYSLPKADFSVLAYNEAEPESKDVSGPRVVVMHGHVYPLTGWCSYRTLNVFRLNGMHYIQSGSCCCGCGITGMELFQITPSGLEEVIADYSLSD